MLKVKNDEKMKSENNSKFEQRYSYSEVFILKTKLDASSDILVVPKKIRLERKSTERKFHVGGQKC